MKKEGNLKIPANKNRLEEFMKLLFGLLLISLPFHDQVWDLPKVGKLIQPAELFIGLYIGVSLIYTVYTRHRVKLVLLDLVPLLWLMTNLIVNFLLIDFTKLILIETLKVFLLVCLYYSVRVTFHLIKFETFLKYFTTSVLIACALAVLGFIINYFGYPNRLCWNMDAYPYLGPIGRAKAFTSTPNMLGSFIMVIFILKAGANFLESPIKKSDYMIYSVLLVSFILAISKTILCLFAAVMLLFIFQRVKSSKRKLFIFFPAFIYLFYIFGSHYVITVKPDGDNIKDNLERGYVSKAVYQSDTIGIYPTAYTEIKRGTLFIISENFPKGIGTRQFRNFVPYLKGKGLYFEKTTSYDPHCTILGVVSSGGLLGVLFIIASIVIFISHVKKYQSDKFMIVWLVLAISILVESTVTDLMNFRHYWILFAIFVTSTVNKNLGMCLNEPESGKIS